MGDLLSWKASVVNSIIKENRVNSGLELGSGDGKFASLLSLKKYVGYDISDSAVTLANEKFDNPNFRTSTKPPFFWRKFDITMSIDVIYHIVENRDFNKHMAKLFSAANTLVVIYSYPKKPSEKMSEHIKFNDFTSWAERQAPGWELVGQIPNKFPFDENYPNSTSKSEFFVYKRRL